MADNLELDAGSGGAILAADDVGSVYYQRVKLVWSADGSAGELSKAEDTQHSSGDHGLMALVVRNDTLAALGGTDGDYVPLQVDADGALFVTNSSMVPGTGATNLGKAIDSAVGATDTGIALLAKHEGDTTHLTSATDDYDVVRISEFGGLHVEPEQHHVIDAMEATAGWAVLGNDTVNFATSNTHVLGIKSLTFDKVDGAANTVFAGIAKTLSSINFGGLSPHDILQTIIYMSDISDVDYVFLRLGDDSSNYNEWRIDAADLTAGIWETLIFEIGDASQAGATGTGVNWDDVDYVAIGVAFNAETDALAGILFDEISFHTNQHVNASVNSEVTSSVNSANVNVQKVGNKVVNREAGNVATGTQRVTVATDDVNLAAIKTAAELIDDAVYIDDADWSDGSSKHILVGGLYQSAPQTVTDGDVAPFQLDVNGKLIVVVSSLPASTGTIEVVGDVAEDANAAGNPVLVGGRYDASPRSLDDTDAGALALTPEAAAHASSAFQTGFAYDGDTKCTMKRASGVAASGTTAILSAVVGKKFRIFGFAAFATAATATNIYLATTTDTDVLGNSGNPIPVATDADGDNIAGFVLPFSAGGWTQTSTANEALNLILSAAQDVIWAITYCEVA